MGQGRGPLEDLQSCHHAGAVCKDVRVAKLPPRWVSLGAGSPDLWSVIPESLQASKDQVGTEFGEGQHKLF